VIAIVACVLCAGLALLAVLGVLRAPLLAVLTELCRDVHRARFWWRVVTIEVIAGTALCASLAMLLVSPVQDWRWVAAVVQGSVAGLLASVAAVMLGVRAFQHERDRTSLAPSP
jgi:hypothetical protein